VNSAPDLTALSPAAKDALILALSARLDAALKLIAELQLRIDELTRPGKTPGNSSLPPSKGQKPNQPQKPHRTGPRAGSLGRKITLAAVPEGLEPGTPFSIDIVALAMYLRFVHAISYKRLSRLLLELYGLSISEGALDAALLRGKPCFDADVAAILARLRRARMVCSDETSVRISGRMHWNWVFQNDDVVIHVIRPNRGAGVVAEVLDGHRPALWVSDLYGAQQGHAEAWQICLAHQLRDCQYAIEAGDTVSPRA
jgi:hypothetical protein